MADGDTQTHPISCPPCLHGGAGNRLALSARSWVIDWRCASAAESGSEAALVSAVAALPTDGRSDHATRSSHSRDAHGHSWCALEQLSARAVGQNGPAEIFSLSGCREKAQGRSAIGQPRRDDDAASETVQQGWRREQRASGSRRSCKGIRSSWLGWAWPATVQRGNSGQGVAKSSSRRRGAHVLVSLFLLSQSFIAAAVSSPFLLHHAPVRARCGVWPGGSAGRRARRRPRRHARRLPLRRFPRHLVRSDRDRTEQRRAMRKATHPIESGRWRLPLLHLTPGTLFFFSSFFCCCVLLVFLSGCTRSARRCRLRPV